MERGFTLVEIAVVVLVLGLLLASLLGPLSVRIEQQEIRKTSNQLEEIKEALYGYAMVNGALPCPDGNGDGMADPLVATTTSPCNDVEGGCRFRPLA
jgi:prepilin-type N-terminal cleavage/methylation domain-containing protein